MFKFCYLNFKLKVLFTNVDLHEFSAFMFATNSEWPVQTVVSIDYILGLRNRNVELVLILCPLSYNNRASSRNICQLEKQANSWYASQFWYKRVGSTEVVREVAQKHYLHPRGIETGFMFVLQAVVSETLADCQSCHNFWAWNLATGKRCRSWTYSFTTLGGTNLSLCLL